MDEKRSKKITSTHTHPSWIRWWLEPILKWEIKTTACGWLLFF